jgi:PAS domain S-box-containing protein
LAPLTDESPRFQALARYAVLDTPPDRAFDDLAELARALTGCAAAGIGFLDRDRVWFKASAGLAAAECARPEFPVDRRDPAGSPDSAGGARAGSPDSAGGARAGSPDGAAAGQVVVVRRPFTIGGDRFGFCAAAPIVSGEGYLLGELFVADPQARRLTDRAGAALLALARQVHSGLELRRTLLSYHAVVDGVGHVVFQTDEEHRVVSLTPTWSRLTGFGVVRSVSQPLVDFVHRDDRARVGDHLTELSGATGAITFECRLLRLLGGEVPVEVIARPLIDEAGTRRGVVGVIADITERRLRAIEAEHARKLEALGRLSTGLAHELNTPIQFLGDNTRFVAEAYRGLSELVLTYRQILGEQCFAGDARPCTPEFRARWQSQVRQAEADADVEFYTQEVPSAIEQSLQGVARVATLVRAMRAFSSAGESGQAPVDLNEALRTAVTVAQSQLGEVADVAWDLADLPPVVCTIGDLNQVFLNLLLNAADAIADTGARGVLTIRTRPDGDGVSVSFTDTGPGVPEELKLRIFEPFFTTKEVGRGTGQGLALARAVVHDQHGGRLTFTSRPGHGATFTIWLPADGRRPHPEETDS